MLPYTPTLYSNAHYLFRSFIVCAVLLNTLHLAQIVFLRCITWSLSSYTITSMQSVLQMPMVSAFIVICRSLIPLHCTSMFVALHPARNCCVINLTFTLHNTLI